MSIVDDLTGKKFNRLTVIERAGSNKHGKALWKCRCDCGSEKTIIASGNALKRNHVKSCGCLKKDQSKKQIEDLTGMKFGRLRVIEMAPHNPGERVKWICECENDGNIIEAYGKMLKNGSKQSCGCLHKEVFNAIITKHSKRHDALYNIWCGMKERCNNKNTKCYDRYGGRGIKVCDEWESSFISFYNDMHDGYTPGLQLDRIDNDKGYSKSNCRWVTSKENNRNRSNNRIISTIFGDITLAEFAERLGVDDNLVRSMIGNGHSVDDVMKRFYKGD